MIKFRGGYWDIYLDNYERLGLLDKRGNLEVQIKNAVVEWLTTGKLPKGGMLERMIIAGVAKSLLKLNN